MSSRIVTINVPWKTSLDLTSRSNWITEVILGAWICYLTCFLARSLFILSPNDTNTHTLPTIFLRELSDTFDNDWLYHLTDFN